jgi:hypothetical protein
MQRFIDSMKRIGYEVGGLPAACVSQTEACTWFISEKVVRWIG